MKKDLEVMLAESLYIIERQQVRARQIKDVLDLIHKRQEIETEDIWFSYCFENDHAIGTRQFLHNDKVIFEYGINGTDEQ